MGHNPTCSICLERFKELTGISACPCGHTFHQCCLRRWMRTCQSQRRPCNCPVCAKSFKNIPATGIIKSLYFNGDTQSSENQAQSEIWELRAEIRDLRDQLASSGAPTNNTSEENSAQVAGLEAVIQNLKSQLAISEGLLKTAKEEKQALEKRRVKEVSAALASREDVIESLHDQLGSAKAKYMSLETCVSPDGNQWRSASSSPGSGVDFSRHNTHSQQALNTFPAPQPPWLMMPPWLSQMPPPRLPPMPPPRLPPMPPPRLPPMPPPRLPPMPPPPPPPLPGPMMFSVTPQSFQQWFQS